MKEGSGEVADRIGMAVVICQQIFAIWALVIFLLKIR